MASLIAFIRADLTSDAPVIPETWDVQIEDNRWATIYPMGRNTRPDVFFHIRLIVRAPGNPGRALFVCTGPNVILNRLASQIALDGLSWTQTWNGLSALRADVGALATTIKSNWPDDRPHTWSGTISNPVDGGPVGTLVALRSRMAGFDSNTGE